MTPDAQQGAYMSPLERHCHLLLFAYPAAYRRERGDEMVGTLLDTTPAGRTWPLPRDVWALTFGGLQARSAHNRGLSMAANLRLAALFGVAIYLSLAAFGAVSWGLRPYGYDWYGWTYWAQGLLVAASILAAWFARRTVVFIAVLLAGGLWYEQGFVASRLSSHDWTGAWSSAWHVPTSWQAWHLAALAALVLLAGGRERPPRLWLALPGLAAAAVVFFRAPDHIVLVPHAVSLGHPAVVGLVVLIFLAFVFLDARPAFALAICLGLCLANQVDVLTVEPSYTGYPPSPGEADWVWLSSALALALLAVWRLRRRRQAVL